MMWKALCFWAFMAGTFELGETQVVIPVGGAEKGIGDVNNKITLQMKAERLAREKTEFVINSKEELVAIMDCTACKRVVLALSNQIIGRVSSEKHANGDTEPAIKELIKGVCSTKSISKTREIVSSCNTFIADSEDQLVEQFYPRTQEDDDLFEETFSVTSYCRTETSFCPPGTKSLDELLGGRIDEQDAAEEEAAKKKRTKKSRKKKRKRSPKKKKWHKQKPKETDSGSDQNSGPGKKRRRRTRRRVRKKISSEKEGL